MSTCIQSSENKIEATVSPNDKIYIRSKSILIKNDNPYANDDTIDNDYLHIENLVDAVLISEIDLVDKIIKPLEAIEENEERLLLLEIWKEPYLFTSRYLEKIICITTSLKTRISMIRLIGPRLIDPNAIVQVFTDMFRFSEDKKTVEDILKARANKLNADKFVIHNTSATLSGGRGLLSSSAGGRGNILNGSGRGGGRGSNGMKRAISNTSLLVPTSITTAVVAISSTTTVANTDNEQISNSEKHTNTTTTTTKQQPQTATALLLDNNNSDAISLTHSIESDLESTESSLSASVASISILTPSNIDTTTNTGTITTGVSPDFNTAFAITARAPQKQTFHPRVRGKSITPSNSSTNLAGSNTIVNSNNNTLRTITSINATTINATMKQNLCEIKQHVIKPIRIDKPFIETTEADPMHRLRQIFNKVPTTTVDGNNTNHITTSSSETNKNHMLLQQHTTNITSTSYTDDQLCDNNSNSNSNISTCKSSSRVESQVPKRDFVQAAVKRHSLGLASSSSNKNTTTSTTTVSIHDNNNSIETSSVTNAVKRFSLGSNTNNTTTNTCNSNNAAESSDSSSTTTSISGVISNDNHRIRSFSFNNYHRNFTAACSAAVALVMNTSATSSPSANKFIGNDISAKCAAVLNMSKTEFLALKREENQTTSEYFEELSYIELVRRNYWKEYDGVIESNLEIYLNDEEFLKVFGKTKDEFSKLPNWRQMDLKKKAMLF